MKARDNPFAVDRLDRLRFRLLDDSWDALLRRLESLEFRAAVVGPHGSGKTTLLDELENRLQAAGHHVQRLRLNEQQPTFPRAVLRRFWRSREPGDIVVLDGAEQLSRFSWWRFLRRSRAAGGLIVTSHRPGLLPTLIECRTNRELLMDLLQELFGGQDATVRDEAQRLYGRHGGNIREVWRALYDQCAEGILVAKADDSVARI